MQCVVLAGGPGTRLGSLTVGKSKSMVEMCGKPFLYHQIKFLADNDIRDIVISVYKYHDQIMKYFGDGSKFGVNIRYSYNEGLGTGGAIKAAEEYLNRVFFVIYGDVYPAYSFFRPMYLEFIGYRSIDCLMSIYKNKNLYDKSNVILIGNKVLYNKKNPTKEYEYIDYGISILDRAILDRMEKYTNYDLNELYEVMSKDNLIGAFEVFDRFYEMGSIQGFRDTENFIKGRLHDNNTYSI